MDDLIACVNGYNYPSHVFSFNENVELKFENYRSLEKYILKELESNDPNIIKNGLSNVLYWGHFRAGYRDVRVNKFRSKIKNEQLELFHNHIQNHSYGCQAIKRINMPEFSGLAFISKVLMFLDPSNYVTLDKKIMQLKDENNFNNPITNIAFRVNDTSIRINDNSQFWYLKWCGLCKKIANEFFMI